MIRRLRMRAALSVKELAELLGVSVDEVAAWERDDPPFSVVERVAQASGFTLELEPVQPALDPHDLSLLDETLRLTPTERLARMVRYVRFIEAGRAAVRKAQ
jgi:transcriptional regulator with XRE-family HTH domain